MWTRWKTVQENLSDLSASRILPPSGPTKITSEASFSVDFRVPLRAWSHWSHCRGTGSGENVERCRKSSTSFDGKCRAGQSIFNDWCQYDVNLMSPDLHQVLHPPLSGSAKSEYRRERPADPGRCRSARVGSGWSSSDDHRGLGRVAPIRSIALWKCLEGLLPGDTHHPPIGWAWTSNPNQNTAHSHLLHSFIACCAKLLGPIFNSHKK